MKSLIVVGSLLAVQSLACGNEIARFDLRDLLHENKLTVFNRDVEPVLEPSRHGLVLSEEYGEGLVWINGVSFSTGTIEIDLKGQDVYQHSFVGIAFRGVDDSTFDAVYFRPFQFLTSDSVRKTRGVQYVSLPEYTWQKLRAERSGVFEQAVTPAPDPNDWFHARIVIHENEVLVYVNHAARPSLHVPLLSDRKKGMIGLYTADRSGGSFGNLTIESE